MVCTAGAEIRKLRDSGEYGMVGPATVEGAGVPFPTRDLSSRYTGARMSTWRYKGTRRVGECDRRRVNYIESLTGEEVAYREDGGDSGRSTVGQLPRRGVYRGPAQGLATLGAGTNLTGYGVQKHMQGRTRVRGHEGAEALRETRGRTP